jgi:hypothetical protein
MMKFKQRLLIIVLFVCIGILYVWVKIKRRNGYKNPLVKISNEENLLRALLLDTAFDFNNLDHSHEKPRILSKPKRTTIEGDRKDKLTKEIASVAQNTATTSNLRTKTSQSRHLISKKPAWQLWEDMVKVREVTQPGHEGTVKVDAIVKALQTAPVIELSVGFKGTQLKSSMFLKGNQRTVFKPKRLVSMKYSSTLPAHIVLLQSL